MLDELDLLDDAAPPDADAEMLARVRGRADRRRRRNRLAVASACIVSLAVVVGGVAVVRDRGRTVDVITPATTPTAPKSVSSELTLPNHLHARMTVENPTVAVGDPIRARVELRNDTSLELGVSFGCEPGDRPVLRDAADRLIAANDDYRGVGCGHAAPFLAPGRSTSVAFTLSTDPVVLPHGERSATYDLYFESISGVHTSWRIGPLPVEIVTPDLTAHIELPTTTFDAGSKAEGTLVVDNPSNAVVHYSVDCNGVPPFDLLLAKDGVIFYVPTASVACLQTQPSPYGIGPGTHRLRFTVGINYWECSGDGPVTVDTPRCLPDGVIPPLPPGQYQIVYQGSGAFGTLEPAPVTIQVVAAAK